MNDSLDGIPKRCVALQSLLAYESDTALTSDEEDSGKDVCGDSYPVRAEKSATTPSSCIHPLEKIKIAPSGTKTAESVSKTDFVRPGCVGEQLPQNESTITSQLLPLPECIQNMFSDVSCESSDCPEEHGGKIRSFAHEQGVWATYIYIEYNAEAEFLELIEALINIANSCGLSLSPNEGFHVSLSRTLKLRHHWIQPFIETLKAQLAVFHRFKVMLQSVEVYVNEENTRTFIGLKVHYGAERLEKLVRKIDKCLDEFKLPTFYKDPSFHLSVAYSVGNIKEKLHEVLPDLNISLQTFMESHPQWKSIKVSNICCKSGNKFFNVPLK